MVSHIVEQIHPNLETFKRDTSWYKSKESSSLEILILPDHFLYSLASQKQATNIEIVKYRIQQSGYVNAYGAMAGISAGVLLFWVPLYIWGKRIRHVTWRWKVTSFVHWNEDREVGE
jgi:hypothetical protein